MAELQLTCFGAFRVTLAGAPLTAFQTDKMRALLVYLALKAEPHQRAALTDFLWPGYAPKSASNSFRQYLHQLRQLLRDAEAEANGRPPYLLITRYTVQLNPDALIAVDVTTFRDLLAQCAQHAHEQLTTCQPCLKRLRQAVDLYQGDFLAGFTVADSDPFEEWRRITQEQLHLQALDALRDLGDAAEAAGDYEQALQDAHRQLALEPWLEAAHRRIMHILAWRGQQAAALAQYNQCRQVLADELGVAPDAETMALYTAIQRGNFDKVTSDKVTESPNHPVTLSPLHDWGEMPAVERLVGRATEVAQLTAWLAPPSQPGQPTAQLISVLGMGGMGKTTLAATVVKAVAPTFAVLIWRSLLNAPPLNELLRDWLQLLSRQTLTAPPESLDEQLRRLLDHLRRERCLLVLDNMESIFATDDAQERVGAARPGYEGYDQLLQWVARSDHQSCLLLTSREQPYALLRAPSGQGRQTQETTGRLRVLGITGLNPTAGSALLQSNGLHTSAQAATQLIQHYSGNPLALQIVAATIVDFFDGDVAAFQQEEGGLFDEIRLVLDQQFVRLSPLEREILVWLAIEREAVTVATLRNNLVQPVSTRDLLEALHALQHRSLLEKRDAGLTLQNVIIEYTTAYLVEQVCEEILGVREPQSNDFRFLILDSTVDTSSSAIQNPKSKIQNLFLNRFALLKAQAKAYVRQSQERLLLAPIGRRLVQAVGRAGALAACQHLLAVGRTQMADTPGYWAGNLCNLLLHLDFDLTGYDFSQLTIRQAYLAHASLANVNFTKAHFVDTLFADDFGHILAVAISPDGTLLAAAGTDTVIRLWRLHDGQRVGELHGHTHAIRTLAFHPTTIGGEAGLLLASASMDQTVRLWVVPMYNAAGMANGHCRTVLQGHEGSVYDLAFHPDGRTLASSGIDQTLRLWDLVAGVEERCLLHTWRGATETTTKVVFSPDGRLIASAGRDRLIRLWHVAHTASGSYQEHLLATLTGHTGSVVALVFSPDGQTLASGSADQTVCVWTVISHAATVEWQLRHTLRGHSHWVRALAFSPDGRTLASGSADRTIRLWSMADGQPLALWQAHEHIIWSIAFSPDGTLLLSGGEDDAIHLWDLRRPRQPHLIRSLQGHTTPIPHLAFSPDGTTLASSEERARLYLWDWPHGRWLRTLVAHSADVHQLLFTAAGKTLISTSSNHSLYFWQVADGQPQRVQHTFPQSPRALAVAPTGALLATAGEGNVIQLWPLDPQRGVVTTSENAPPQATLHGHTDEITGLAFLPGAAGEPLLLASSSDDQSVRLWDVTRGCSLHVLQETHYLTSLAVSPDGTLLASGGGNGAIWLWQLAPTPAQPNGEFPRRLTALCGHQAAIRRLAFRPAAPGQPPLLASASEDQTVRLWDVNSGHCRQILQGHRQYVLSVAFSPDGATLASSSFDQTIRLWDVATGACLRVLQPPGLYAGMKITGVTGISAAQKAALRALGAVE